MYPSRVVVNGIPLLEFVSLVHPRNTENISATIRGELAWASKLKYRSGGGWKCSR